MSPDGALIILHARGKLTAFKAPKDTGILRARDVNNVSNVTKCRSTGSLTYENKKPFPDRTLTSNLLGIDNTRYHLC